MNRYINIMLKNEDNYKGKIKSLLNDTRVRLSEIRDMYAQEAVTKYEEKAINEAMDKIKEIQQSYLKSTAALLDNEQYRINNPQVVTLSNTQQLLNEIRKSNELQMNRLKIASMSNDDIIESCNECSNEAYVLEAKNQLLTRANAINDENKANELREVARAIQPFTEQMELDIALKEFEAMTADRNLMPGVPLGEKLVINDIEEFLLQDTKLQADRLAQATD